MTFHGKLALVTGATRGLGWAVAEALAAEGAHVLMVGRTQGALEELYDLIKKNNGEATGVPMDITDGDALDRLGASIAERWGKLDLLVGNAGVLGPLDPEHGHHPKILDAFGCDFGRRRQCAAFVCLCSHRLLHRSGQRWRPIWGRGKGGRMRASG